MRIGRNAKDQFRAYNRFFPLNLPQGADATSEDDPAIGGRVAGHRNFLMKMFIHINGKPGFFLFLNRFIMQKG